MSYTAGLIQGMSHYRYTEWDGTQVFPDLEALFRAALHLLDEAAEEASP